MPKLKGPFNCRFLDLQSVNGIKYIVVVARLKGAYLGVTYLFS